MGLTDSDVAVTQSEIIYRRRGSCPISVSWLSISMCPQDEDEGQATYEYSNSCLYTYDFNYQMLMHVRRVSL